MKKTEIIHVHNLLGTLATDLHESGAVTEADLKAYRDLDTSPMAIRGSRSDHEEAVLALADALATGVTGDRERTETEGADGGTPSRDGVTVA